MREVCPDKMIFCELSSKKALYAWKFEKEHPPLGQVVLRKVAVDAKGNSLWCTGEHTGPCRWPLEAMEREDKQT